MCSEYNVKATSRDISEALGSKLIIKPDLEKLDRTIKFSTRAPVLERSAQGLELVERVFPVSPFPNSRLSGFENQTEGKDEESSDDDEKQIRRIYQVPRWKSGFAGSPLLVPMTSFTEFAYWGEKAGSALAFKIPKEKMFFAAALGIKPFVPKTGKVDGFSILTHTATKQMLEHHHRLIVLLEPEHAAGYLEEMEPEERFNYLIKHRYSGELEVDVLRKMAKGWEKRVATQKHKLAREESYRSTLKKEHVPG